MRHTTTISNLILSVVMTLITAGDAYAQTDRLDKPTADELAKRFGNEAPAAWDAIEKEVFSLHGTIVDTLHSSRNGGTLPRVRMS